MKQADIQELQSRAAELAKASSVGDRVRNVTVEPGEYEETGEFLRVIIELEDVEHLPLEEMHRLVQAIEDAIPSVRFADAA